MLMSIFDEPEPHVVAITVRSAIAVGQAAMLPFMATVSTVSVWPAKIFEVLSRAKEKSAPPQKKERQSPQFPINIYIYTYIWYVYKYIYI